MTKGYIPSPTSSIAELKDNLKRGTITAEQLAEYYFDRINSLNKKLNALNHIQPKRPNHQLTDSKIFKNHNQQALAGIPIIHKDVFCTKDMPTTAGSKILQNYLSPFDAHIVAELKKAGSFTIGKSNMDEFAMGSANENSAFGNVKNPWDTQLNPGGSSGGSAVCVAAGLTVVATGSDTGGSIRLPASHCGVTGIKPGYGMVSRYGMVAYASSLDQAGVFARRAVDCAEVLDVMMHHDNRDSTQIPQHLRPQNSLMEELQNLNSAVGDTTIGICTSLINKCEDATKKVMENSIEMLKKIGYKTIDIDFEISDEMLSAYYIIATAEASSNLSRYDGIRYGNRFGNADQSNNVSIDELFSKSRANGFGKEVKRRILLGTFVLSHGYYDSYYLGALKMRRKVVNTFNNFFNNCHVLALPVSTGPAKQLNTKLNLTEEYWLDVFTAPINLAGLPAMSLPIGFVEKANCSPNYMLPVGLQLTAPFFCEGLMLNIANKFQSVSDYHLQTPTIN